jgi:hypothetical protein
MIRFFKKSTPFKTREISDFREFIEKKYGLKISRKKYNKYVYLYSKYTNNKMTMYDATFDIAENIERFVYFIHGYNAYWQHRKSFKE